MRRVVLRDASWGAGEPKVDGPLTPVAGLELLYLPEAGTIGTAAYVLCVPILQIVSNCPLWSFSTVRSRSSEVTPANSTVKE
jgi:hypothetical protein